MANGKQSRCANGEITAKAKPGHLVIEALLAQAVLRGMKSGDGVAETSQIPRTVDLQLGVLAEQSVHTDPSQIEGVCV